MNNTNEFKGPVRRHITTAIPYVNAAPHIGFALEVIQADCLARLYRSQGDKVNFLAGTDDNSLKNVQAAEARRVGVQDLVRENAAKFLELKSAFGLSYDDFIQTSSDPRHRPGVEKLWSACFARGDIYKRFYEGLYCLGCEQFYRPQDLVDGKCPEHRTKPELVAEENYFFRLSRYQEQLRKAIVSGELTITPESRKNEVLATIDRGLEDFSISRSAERARGWGIRVPGDPDQVIYVWFDALANYITSLDYGKDGAGFSRSWEGAATREHCVGKGITRFHAIYWPAMLLSAGLSLPTRIFVHGYITVEGQKIGKSAGNAIDPVPLAEELGPDALRYFLLRYIRSTEDGDFVRERFLHSYDNDLAGQLGNLLNRTTSMIARYLDGTAPKADPTGDTAIGLDNLVKELSERVASEIENFRFDAALAAIWRVIGAANQYVTHAEPWALAKVAEVEPKSEEAIRARSELENCLGLTAQALVTVGECLAPFLPSTSEKLLSQLGKGKVRPGPLLFPKRN